MMNNPLANDAFIGKVKTRKKTNDSISIDKVEVYTVGYNDAVNICANACACCWDRKVPDGYSAAAEYIGKRTKIGHTSVIEHSNHVMYIKIGKNFEDYLVSFLSSCNYLNKKAYKSSDGSCWHLLIGGSYRAYSDLYKEATDLNDPILKAITGQLYVYSNSAFFEDVCEYKLMDKSSFINSESLIDEKCGFIGVGNKYSDVLIDIIGCDSIGCLYSNIYKVDKEAANLFTNDLINFATVSVLFKNMSRTCTHQLVRHRNAVTQESQRYVNYGNASFSSPEIFKPGKYDPNHKYKITFGDSTQMLTLSEIGENITGIYNMVSDPSIAGQYSLLKEDARAFLPGNIQCGKIYMTFTYSHLMKFLELRENEAAQAEIRKYANDLGLWFRDNTSFSNKEDDDSFNKPRLVRDELKLSKCITDAANIYNPELDKAEEFVKITEEDYIKAAGLDKEDDTENANNASE